MILCPEHPSTLKLYHRPFSWHLHFLSWFTSTKPKLLSAERYWHKLKAQTVVNCILTLSTLLDPSTLWQTGIIMKSGNTTAIRTPQIFKHIKTYKYIYSLGVHSLKCNTKSRYMTISQKKDKSPLVGIIFKGSFGFWPLRKKNLFIMGTSNRNQRLKVRLSDLYLF